MTAPARVPYRVETERACLRCWAPGDAPLLRASIDRSHEHLLPWIPFMREEPRSLEETTDWLRQRRASFDTDENYGFAIFTPDEATLLGETMLLSRAGPGALEIGYWIDVRHKERGLATETTAAMTRLSFEVFGVDRVEIRCAPGNAASVAIPRKLGFTHEATLARRHTDPDGEYQDLMVWSLFASAYPGSPSRSFSLRAFDALGRALPVPPEPDPA